MKKLKNIILLALTTMVMFANAQSYVQIGTGTTSNNQPFYGSWNNTWSKTIYLQSEIGTAKTITEIAYNLISGPLALTNQKIYMKHVVASSLATAYEEPVSSGYTLVYDGTITLSNTGWNSIDITDFSYNGTDNLVILVEDRNNTGHYKNFYCTDYTGTRVTIAGCDVSGCFPTTAGYSPYPTAFPNIRMYYASTGPATPATPNPTDNQDIVSLNTTLSVNIGAHTTNYDLYFGTDSLDVLNLTSSLKVVDNATVSAPGTYNYTPTSILSSKTKYFWKVVAKNSTQTEVSPLWKFTTELLIASFPYSQGFEDSTVFYPGWYGLYTDWAYTSTGSNAIWHASTNSYTGSNAAYASPSTSTTSSTSLTTPRFNLPANYRISYWWKCTSISGGDTTFFEISTNGGTTWTKLDTLSPTTAMSAYVQRFHNLSSYAGNNVKFQWRYQRGTTSSLKDAYIDDIKVEEIPTGATMTLSTNTINFKKLFVNGTTKAKVIIGNIGTSNLVISGVTVNAPFSCGYTGTILPGASDTATVIMTATTQGVFSENLTINTNGSGNNVIALSDSVLALLPSLYETFESTPINTIPTDWSKLRSNDPYQTVNDIVVKSSSYDAYSVPNVVKFYNNSDTVSPLILITPGVTNFANDSLKFWASKTAGVTNNIELIVGLMDDPYDGSSFVPVQTITLADSMVQYAIAFNVSNTKPYIAFKHGQNKPSHSIWLDDVSWQGSIPSVPNPAAVVAPLNNAINVVTKPTLKWTPSGGNPTGYKLFLGTNNPPTNLVNGTDLQDTLQYKISTQLNFNTIYYWKIVPYNANGDATSVPVWNFTTLADPTITSFPWTEGFESVTPNAGNADFPLGWSMQNAGMQSSYWDIILNNTSNPNNAHTGQKAMNIMFSMLGSNNDWLFTPPVHLTGGTSYDFSFWYKAPTYVEQGSIDTTFEKMAVIMGTAADSNAMTLDTIFKDEFMRFPNYVQHSKIITPATTGNYTFGFHSYSDVLQWITMIDDIKIQVSNGINENAKIDFAIYPNPNNGDFMVVLNDELEKNTSIKVINTLGQNVLSSNITSKQQRFNLSNLDKGLYFITIENGNAKTTSKIIIK